jgi:hypothetical protein
MMYLARNNVSICAFEGSAESFAGSLSMMATFLRTRVVNGLMCSFSKTMSPSSFSDRASVTLPAMNVCTCGSCKARAPANNVAAIATIARQIILYDLLIVFKVYGGPTYKDSKNLRENP